MRELLPIRKQGLGNRRLYLISDGLESLSQLPRLLSEFSRYVAGVQIREQKGTTALTDEELLRHIQFLVEELEQYSVPLLINARVDLALKYPRIDGVHLGASTESPTSVRKKLGPTAILGYSAHSIEEIQQQNDADFFTLSPIYQPTSKAADSRLHMGPSVLAQMHTEKVVFALGGVLPERTGVCLTAGADGIAIQGSLFRSNDPLEQMRKYAEAIDTFNGVS